MDSHTASLSSLSATFQLLTKNPTDFLSKDNQRAEDFRLLSKNLFDFVRQSTIRIPHSTDLSELLISDDFDDEQVWQQLELDNRLLVDGSVKNIAALLADDSPEFLGHSSSNIDEINGKGIEGGSAGTKSILKKRIPTKFGKVTDDQSDDDEDDLEEDVDGEDDTGFSDEDDSAGEVAENDDDSDANDNMEDDDQKDQDAVEEDGFGPSDEEEDIDGDVEMQKNPTRKGFSSVLDDDFFRLSEMNQYILENEKEEEKGGANGDSDLFFHPDDEEDEEEAADIKYSDFFGPPPTKASKTDSGQMSTFEKRQEKMQERIREVEEEALNPKPWQLAGEVSAAKRPENSLLEEYLQFDHVSRQAPLITEDVTKTLENLILQRVKDKAFDDVERKVKPKDADAYEYKKKLVLDDMKSKQSLSQIYEQEYLNKVAPQDQSVEKDEHRKIRTAMNELFVKLDALSNFHFVPKPVAPDIKIINNLPTVVVEEVQPSAVSSAQLLAPEEVLRAPREELKGSTEVTSTDKKRARRKKKVHQHVKGLKQKIKENEGTGDDKKKKKMGKAGGVSSTAFFDKLQDAVKQDQAVKKGKKDDKKRTKDDDAKVSAKKFKL